MKVLVIRFEHPLVVPFPTPEDKDDEHPLPPVLHMKKSPLPSGKDNHKIAISCSSFVMCDFILKIYKNDQNQISPYAAKALSCIQ